MASFSLDAIKSGAEMDPNDINKYSKILLAAKYAQAKFKNPKLTQAQLAKLIGSSPSTLYRTRVDINMDSPHIYIKYL